MDFIIEKYQEAARDEKLLIMLLAVFALLTAGTLAGQILKMMKKNDGAIKLAENFNARVKTWWIMCAIFLLAVATGGIGSILLFCFTSFLALREFISIVPTRRSDHRLLVWCFWIILPAQYLLVYCDWYNMFIILIPVYAFLFIPTRSVIAGDCTDFLARTAKIQWALMACVYCVSHVPMLFKLPLNISDGQLANVRLLFFLVTVVELSDIFQYCWGKTLGRHKILPSVSPNKTVEGFILGVATATGAGAILALLTPFTLWQGALIALAVTMAGFAGDVTMSAIKRDCGVKDYGTMLAGHGGMLDRIDSLCFAAPIFFHIVRYFFTD